MSQHAASSLFAAHNVGEGANAALFLAGRTLCEALVFVPGSHRRGVMPKPIKLDIRDAGVSDLTTLHFYLISSHPTC